MEGVFLHPDLSREYFAMHPVSPIGSTSLPATCPFLRVNKSTRRHYLSILRGLLSIRGACQLDLETEFVYTLEYIGFARPEPGVRTEMPFRWVVHFDGMVVGHVHPWTDLWKETLHDPTRFLGETKRMMAYIWDDSPDEREYDLLLQSYGIAGGVKNFRRHLVNPLKRVMQQVRRVDTSFQEHLRHTRVAKLLR